MLSSGTQLDQEQRRKLTLINRSGHHLLMLINDILELSRIETGRLDLQLAPVDLRMLFNAVLAAVRLRTDPGQVELLLRCDAAPAVVMADGAKLRQVLLNLLSNAVKFAGRGQVTLTVQPLAATLADPTDGKLRLYFSVSDNGPGIAAPDQQQIFQPFVQGETAATKTGTGLGLTISREFVRLMGGELELDSTVGAGATFWFVLDLEPCEAPPAPTPAEALLRAMDELGALAMPAGPAAPDQVELQMLAPAQRAALKEAVANLDLASVDEVISQIEQQQPALAAHVRRMVAAAQFPQLWEQLD
jgi:K+-sensing histidine kinase KdpD